MVKEEDGKKYIYLYVPSACTKNTPYAFYTTTSGSQVPIQSAMPAANAICRVVVATETLTAAGYSWFQFAGPCDDLVTPSITGVTNQTLKIASAVVAAGGAATVTADDFAIVKTGGTDTAFDVYLLDREITPS
jgi:hypothetical protein